MLATEWKPFGATSAPAPINKHAAGGQGLNGG